MDLMPPADDLGLLSPTERVAYWMGSFSVRYLRIASWAWNVTVICPLVWMATGRRLSVGGLEHVHPIPIADPVILVANHRSFFDFFLVTQLFRYRGGGLLRHFFFPVRSRFFYDTVPGMAVNFLAAGMSMFPPVFRELSKGPVNRHGMDRCIEELSNERMVLGLHPEGTRNRGDDPFDLLPAKPGIGKVILAARSAHVVPVFIYGLGNGALTELGYNVAAPEQHPIRVLFGPEIDFSDLRSQSNRPKTQKLATDRCVAALMALAGEVRAGVSSPG
jgi:1-acyl-sn-glycerol-3-phosphate acyltransferase